MTNFRRIRKNEYYWVNSKTRYTKTWKRAP